MSVWTMPVPDAKVQLIWNERLAGGLHTDEELYETEEKFKGRNAPQAFLLEYKEISSFKQM